MGLKKKSGKAEMLLTDEERAGLKPSFVRNRSELDALESSNILDAEIWLLRKSFRADQVLTTDFLRRLHREMFGKVWKSAGRFRELELNDSVKGVWVPVEVQKLTDDMRRMVREETHPPLEIAVRFMRRLVAIQCFETGSGRHSRLAADLLGRALTGARPFTWGRNVDLSPEELRKVYQEALRKADAGDMKPLLAFSLS